MFKALFLGTLFVTLAVNLIFLLATRDKPPDLITTTSGTPTAAAAAATASSQTQRRLVLRSNDFYDYASEPEVRQSSERNISINTTTPRRQTSEARHSNETRAIGSERVGGVTIAQSAEWKDTSEAASNQVGGDDGDDQDNEITSTRRELRLSVKSSRSHVLVSVDNSIIYESGAELFPGRKQHRHAGSGATNCAIPPGQ